jgi:NADH-quinone oxidoreductase subunit M
MLYERYHTREIQQLGGLARRLPWLAFFMLVFTLSSIGLPGMNGFAGEFLVLLGMFQRAWGDAPPIQPAQLHAISVLAVAGVALGAWYMLWLVRRVFFGPLREPRADASHTVSDLQRHELAALAPLAVLVVWIGIYPTFFLQRMAPTLDGVTAVAQKSLNVRYGDAARTLGTREFEATQFVQQEVSARDR